VTPYCERTAAGLWGEPLNAVTNLAFLVASGLLLWLLTRREPALGLDRQGGVRQRRAAPNSVRLLPVLLGVVGLCSLAFHTLRTPFTAALDALSILAFVLAAVVVIAHWMWGVPWRWAWLAAPAFAVFAVGLDAALVGLAGERGALGGYLPALVGLVGIGAALRWRPELRRYGTLLLWASAVFAVSLTARTLDLPLCAHLPVGTHFIWHTLNAVVLFLVGYAVLRRWRLSPP
jgi:hypothetical protein